MYCVRNVTEDLYWVGANDHRLTLFENIHPIPRGVSYNAYLLLDEKTVLFDTVDWSACRQLLENMDYLLIRGLGAGAMHIVCGAIIGYGLAYVWNRQWLKIAGTLGLLGATIAFHGTYNLLISYGSWVQHIAYVLPIATVMIGVLFDKLFMPRLKTEYR